MATIVNSIGLQGINGYLVSVEIKTIYGQPILSIVGLGDASIKEARERVESAIRDNGYKFSDKKVVINLAPSHIRKSGSHYDLPIALGLIQETGQLEDMPLDHAFIGELSLDGTLRPVKGVLSMVIAAKEAGIKHVVLPYDNILEGNCVHGITCLGFKYFNEVIDYLLGKPYCQMFDDVLPKINNTSSLDFSDVKGQNLMVTYLLAAAAGGHHFLMIGPPGCGKSMIAKRIPSILPLMTKEESLEVTKIYSVTGLNQGQLLLERPFRSPHHNVSTNAMIGGGIYATPGEISLAHHGILFLDEMAEFNKRTLDALRQPLEDGHVTISRVSSSNSYPAQFMLIGAMNPCPCGYYGDARCTCTASEIQRYRNKLSGPILERMDIQKYVRSVPFMDLTSYESGPSSQELRKKVEKARHIQSMRFKHNPMISCNAQMNASAIEKHCVLDEASKKMIEQAFKRFNFSARTFHKYLRIARTFADLDESENIQVQHIMSALNARDLEKDEKR